jgi:hypothetical protein
VCGVACVRGVRELDRAACAHSCAGVGDVLLSVMIGCGVYCVLLSVMIGCGICCVVGVLVWSSPSSWRASMHAYQDHF